MVYLMDRAIGYYADAAQITGIVYDSQTMSPIEGSRVEVLEHSGNVLKPRLTNEFGRYRRILDVGTYTFAFKADGYLHQEVSLVANNSGITEHHIYLEPAPMYQLNMSLVHSTDYNVTITGTISNEFKTNEITISSGDNIIDVAGGDYKIEFLMGDGHVPWDMDLVINSNLEVTIPYEEGMVSDLGSTLPWQESVGTWTMEDAVMRTQGEMLYDNADSTYQIMSMVSELVNVTDRNRVVVELDHRYETEWDHDMISVSIIDDNDVVLGSRSWSGDSWNAFDTELITATTDSSFGEVRVKISFMPDQTVNYRGWEIRSLVLYAMSDEYLGTKVANGNIAPRIPMRISGIYPNPSLGRFQINIDNSPGGDAFVEIFNILGQNVLSQNFQNISSGKHFIDLDLSHMNGMLTSSGMFFIRIQTQTEQAVKKCIILKN